MRNQTQLGMTLGQMLAGAFGGNSDYADKGALDGMKVNQLQSDIELKGVQAEKARAEADQKRREIELGSDDSLGKIALLNSGVGTEGRSFDDFKKYQQTGYVPLVTSYANKMPDAAKVLANLRIGLAGGNKNIDLQKIGQGIQRNNITAGVTPENAADVAMQASTLEANPNPLEVGRASVLRDLRENPQGNSLADIALLSQGKDTHAALPGGTGTYSTTSGVDQINNIGTSVIGENSAKANQANAGAAKQRSGIAVDQARIRQLDAKTGASGSIPEKPMPVAALKLQDENLESIASASGINSDLSNFVKQIDSGSLNLGFLANALSGAKNFAGMSDEQSRNLQSFKSTLEKMRNASLSLNKGVQTDGDAQRAWNELVTNINDPKVVRQRLIEIQALNARAAKLKMAKNNVLRRNYGAQEMDYTPYLYQDTAIDSRPTGQPTVSQPVNKLPSGSKQIGTSKGKPVYQTPDGKKFIGD
jgi:hypothetical protein